MWIKQKGSQIKEQYSNDQQGERSRSSNAGVGCGELGVEVIQSYETMCVKLLKIVKYYRILRALLSILPAWPLLINTNSLHQYSDFHVYKMLSNHSRYNIHKISTQLNHYHLQSIDENWKFRNEFLKAKQLLSVRAEIWIWFSSSKAYTLITQGVRVTEPKLKFCLHSNFTDCSIRS